jgi:hypothetical protein
MALADALYWNPMDTPTASPRGRIDLAFRPCVGLPITFSRIAPLQNHPLPSVLFFIVSLCLLLSVAEAKSPRVEIPEQLPPHPRLFVNQQEIRRLKDWAAREPWFAAYLDQMVERLKKTAADPKLPDEHRGANVGIAKRAHEYAIAYTVTGDRQFAEAAAKILLAWVDLFPNYQISGMKGKATSATLGECDWAIHAASAYDLIYNAGVLTAKEKESIEQDVLKASAEVMRQCNHKFRSNWRGRAIAGVAIIGFCIDDRELIEEALNGVRDDSGRMIRDGFVQHVAWSILADGVFYERSLHYQLYTADAYALIAEVARHSGLDLWNLEVPGHPLDAGADVERTFGPTGNKTVKGIFDSPFYEAFSDFSLVRLGNSYADRLERTRCYEPAFRAYRDPKYAWLLRRSIHFVRPIAGGGYIPPEELVTAKKKAEHAGKAPRRPFGPLELLWLVPDLPAGQFDHAADARIGATGRHENSCTVLPNGGITVLRQSADPAAVGVQMTYGDWGSAHTHPELLAITVSANGHQMIPEVRYHHYGHDDFLSWDRQSIAHNTVTVDEVSQYPQDGSQDRWAVERGGKQARGRPIFFHPGSELKAFRAECDAAYEGVLLNRTVVLLGGTIVDFFRCRSEQPHRYDYTLHIDGKLAESTLPLGDAEEAPVSSSLGYEHLLAPRRGRADGEPAELRYRSKKDRLRIDLLSSGASEVIAATGHANLKGATKEVLLVRKQGNNVDFVDVLSFPPREEGREVRQVVDLPAGVLGVQLVAPDGTSQWVLSSEDSQTFEFKGQKITGQLALLEQNKGGTMKLVDVVP